MEKWRENADDNASSDETIDWREGQAPSTVNNSARAMMSRLYVACKNLTTWGKGIEGTLRRERYASVTSYYIDYNNHTVIFDVDITSLNPELKDNVDLLKSTIILNIRHPDISHAELKGLDNNWCKIRYKFNLPGMENKEISSFLNRVWLYAGTGQTEDLLYNEILDTKDTHIRYQVFYQSKDNYWLQRDNNVVLKNTIPVTYGEAQGGAFLTYYYDEYGKLHLLIKISNPKWEKIDAPENSYARSQTYWFKVPNNIGNAYYISSWYTNNRYTSDGWQSQFKVTCVNRWKNNDGIFITVFCTDVGSGVHEMILDRYPDADWDFPVKVGK